MNKEGRGGYKVTIMCSLLAPLSHLNSLWTFRHSVRAYLEIVHVLLNQHGILHISNKNNEEGGTRVLIVDGNSEHVAHVRRKIGLFR